MRIIIESNTHALIESENFSAYKTIQYWLLYVAASLIFIIRTTEREIYVTFFITFLRKLKEAGLRLLR